MVPSAPNRVQITLPDKMAVVTGPGDHDIHVTDDGRLTVMEYSEPRNTGCIVAVFAPGQWVSAIVQAGQSDGPF